ncbi:MAG: helicase-related protein [bacterium]
MPFEVGSLVKARGREWVVLPESAFEENLLVLRPLGGSDDEITGIYLPLEKVESARFSLPDPADMGGHLSCALLRDAVRFGIRSGAGPFRSLGRIAVDPRPYQVVPLLMALKLDPVRILIADDVGVGKTVEACLVARELLDRGEVQRMAVLCPPHLAEQWQRDLRRQFHIEAELVLAGTAARLERELGMDQSLFEQHPFVVVSMDYIKSERRRHEFLRTCPELVIVDEAHGCASADDGQRRSTRQQRHELLRDLVKDESRHLILVTATPHSGNEAAFRSLLTLLSPDFENLPEDLSGETNRKSRERLAAHLVQRRRPDIESYLGEETPFPRRDSVERAYRFSPEYAAFFDKVVDFCRERVLDETLEKRRQRVRWWSSLALLRALGSSPLAAAATLRNRAASADTTTVEEADEIGRRTVLDLDEDAAEGSDVIPGSQDKEETEGTASDQRRLLALAREAEKLAGSADRKLDAASALVEELLSAGFSPIVFCRFIPTVDYFAEALRKRLSKDVAVEGVTGLLVPEDREARVAALGTHPKRVLVCTDCLSEGINLQDDFDAVLHYDLSWNPTRHEQREGRVDRYGQRKKVVRAVTLYGQDSPIDGHVLEVLLRKHEKIRHSLGISVPVPHDSELVSEALFKALLLRETGKGTELGEQLVMGFLQEQEKELHAAWDRAAEREKRSRTLFAQHSIKIEEVEQELHAARTALGGPDDVGSFVRTGLQAAGATVTKGEPMRVVLRGLPGSLRDALGALGHTDEFEAVFRPAALGNRDDRSLLARTHPFVEGLASWFLETALDPMAKSPARRCGVVRTKAVTKRTTLLLLRLRFHLVTRSRDGAERALLAEDQALAGFQGAADRAEWVPAAELQPLLDAQPAGNPVPEADRHLLEEVRLRFDLLVPRLERIASERADELLDAHRRVRKAAQVSLRSLRVEPQPPDVLGLYVYLPVVEASR